MPLTNKVLARLAKWARHIEAHDRRTEAPEGARALTHRDFTADLAALVESVAAKDRAIEDLIEAGYVAPETPPAWMAICARAHAARG